MSLNETELHHFLNYFLLPYLYNLLSVSEENAALVSPVLPKEISKNDGRILISSLEAELSTRFNLIARSAVDKALKQAYASLPKDECIEENCL